MTSCVCLKNSVFFLLKHDTTLNRKFKTEADYSNETHVQRRRREMEALAEMQRRERELMAARKNYDEMMKRRYNEEQENEE